MFALVPAKKWNSQEPLLTADLQGELGQCPVSELEGHQNIINGCVWNADRNHLATASVSPLSHCHY